MEITFPVAVSTIAAIAALVAIWQAIVQTRKSREEFRDEFTEWRTKADIKLDSIDVAWKPGVDMMLTSLDNRMGHLERQLLENIGNIVEKLERTNELLGEMNKHLAVYETRLNRVESDVDSHTSKG